MSFSAGCVIKLRRPSNSTVRVDLDARLEGDLGASFAGASTSAGPSDLYVTFQYARLRDLFLSRMRDVKGCALIYPGVPPGTRLRYYEVLRGSRYSLFRDIWAAADLREVNVWHFDGDIKGRAKAGGRFKFKIFEIGIFCDFR